MSIRFSKFGGLLRVLFLCFRVAAQPAASQLEIGRLVTQTLQPGTPDTFLINVADDDFVRIEVDQREIQLRLKILDPKDQTTAEFALPRDSYGPFPLYFSPRTAGQYRLKVEMASETAGTYAIVLRERRRASVSDQTFLSAQTHYFKALQSMARADKQGLTDAAAEFENAAAQSRSSNDVWGQAAALVGAGVARTNLSQNDKAVELLEQAIDHWGRLRNARGEAVSLVDLAFSQYQLGKLSEALKNGNRALSLSKEANSRKTSALAFNVLAAVAVRQGAPTTAIENLNSALALQRELGDRGGEVATLNNLATLYSAAGETRKAIGFFDEVLRLSRLSHTRRTEGVALMNRAAGHEFLSEHQAALDDGASALEVFRSLGDQRSVATVLNNEGTVYGVLGDADRALTLYQQALPLRKAAGDTKGEAITSSSIGFTLSLLGRYDEALFYLQHALELATTIGDLRGQSDVWNNIADVEKRLGHREKALEGYAEALRIRTTVNDKVGQAYAHLSMARAREEWGELEVAETEFSQALAISKSVEDRRTETESLYGLAKMADKRGDLVTAQHGIEDAILLVESLRVKLVDPAFRASYLASVRGIYEVRVDILMQLGERNPTEHYAELAFEASEAGRARGLLDTLAEAHVDVQSGVPPALLERQRSFRELIAAKADEQVRTLNAPHSEASAAAVKAQLDQLIDDLHEVEVRIREENPRYGSLTQPHIATVQDVQTKLVGLDSALLEYALGERRSYVWVVTKDSTRSFELPARDVIENAARRLYASVTSRPQGGTNGSTETQLAAVVLSRIILDPVAAFIKGKRLLVVADGVLRYIPFAVLREPDLPKNQQYVPLIQQHEIINLSSASSAVSMREQPAKPSTSAKLVAVFADPVFDKGDSRVNPSRDSAFPIAVQPRAESTTAAPVSVPLSLERSVSTIGLSRSDSSLPRLPFTRREADSIVATAPHSQTFEALDFQASIDTLDAITAQGYRVVHFATHGLLNTSQPELSGLVLSLVDATGKPQRGFLELADIYNLKLSTELVVLSACQTGLGKDVKGEGLVGLTRGFLFAGSRGVVASLWKVDDAATAALMEQFYKGMLQRQLRPAAALREAEIKTWKQRRWASPYFWGAFVYEGEWQ